MEITTARYINVNGSLLDLSQPRVMGILNVTPDSFYAGSRTQTEAEIVRRVKQIVSEGAAIIDIGSLFYIVPANVNKKVVSKYINS